MPVPTIVWEGDLEHGAARLIDQTRLPGEYVVVACETAEAMWEALRSLRVRGAPAIGVAAAFGAVLGIRGCRATTREKFEAEQDALRREIVDNVGWMKPRIISELLRVQA